MVALSPHLLAYRASTSKLGQWLLLLLLTAPAVAIIAYKPANAIATNAVKLYRWVSRAASVLPGLYGGIELDAEQAENAQIIIEVGRELGATDRDLEIALMTAYQESNLRNLDHGDRDSLGLFQQRPSQDWGTAEQITDPRYAATAFFKGAGTNPGLLTLDNRETLDPLEASHQVQRSAYPEAPGQWADMARDVVANAGQPDEPLTDLDRAIASIGKPQTVSWTGQSEPLKSGDMIGSFRVSRGIIPGEHEGVDVATPEGTPLFIPGIKGESVTVECNTQTDQNGGYSGWGVYGEFHVPSTGKTFLVAHLSECNPGQYQPGEVWGYSGNTGRSTGPHSHVEQFHGSKASVAIMPEEPTRVYIEQIHGIF